MSEPKVRSWTDLHDGGRDGLTPLKSLDIKKSDDFTALLSDMAQTAFGGRALGEAQEVFAEMVSDPDCLKVGTFSGAMSVAKMGLIICDMIDWGWLDIIISTGALMAHGLIESVGLTHYKYDSAQTDADLYDLGYNRIYDTLEMEKNLNHIEEIISGVLEGLDLETAPLSSEIFCREVGKYLSEITTQPGILRNAYLKGIPVYIPAFTDSELGLDMATCFIRKVLESKKAKNPAEALGQMAFNFNPFFDLGSYTQRVLKASKMGIFTIGGGVPRNWAQQVGPFLEILQHRLNQTLPLKRFTYGVRICPEPAHWGGLSGCTYSEGVSWGKFASIEDGGRYAEVLCDATIAWPILMAGVRQKILNKEKGSTK
ncbi:MAG: deoxyhypusine synthase family protein [Deltaproteobacteria bacterium]|nr:deoxyhypusine synthase family protein [Deltaproteobacteria bacterium]